jgi:hypothetical protein
VRINGVLKEIEETRRPGKRRSCITEKGLRKTYVIFEVMNYRNTRTMKKMSLFEAFLT